jgi:hypothetical protein
MTHPTPSAMLAMEERLRAMALSFTDASAEAFCARRAADMLRDAALAQPATHSPETKP